MCGQPRRQSGACTLPAAPLTPERRWRRRQILSKHSDLVLQDKLSAENPRPSEQDPAES